MTLKNAVQTLDDLIYKYLKFQENVKSASAHTLRAYVKDLDQAFSTCKSFKLMPGDTDAEAKLLHFCWQAQSNWAPLELSSRNRKAATLKSFLKYLFSESITEKDLSLRIQCPKVPKKVPRFLSVDEVISCLRSFDQDLHESTQEFHHTLNQQKLLFLLLYGGGLRVSEACNIKCADFSKNGRQLKVRGKGNKERLVILPEMVAEYVNSFINNFQFIWGNDPLSSRKAFEWIRRRGVQAQLHAPLSPHALRHSYATHLLSSGANLRTLQELLGHSSLQATEKYTHLTTDQLARTLELRHPLGKKN